MNKKLNDILTIKELSSYLKIPKSTFYTLAWEDKVPCCRIGCHWRFQKKAIDHWLEKMHGNPKNGENN